ncbi:MAG: hypothetical protein WC455_27865 [Dehalococcoidia bacterium]|jgi:hypothetical protein
MREDWDAEWRMVLADGLTEEEKTTQTNLYNAMVRMTSNAWQQVHERWPTMSPTAQLKVVGIDKVAMQMSVPWVSTLVGVFGYEKTHEFTAPMEDFGWFRGVYVREADIVYISPKSTEPKDTDSD